MGHSKIRGNLPCIAYKKVNVLHQDNNKIRIAESTGSVFTSSRHEFGEDQHGPILKTENQIAREKKGVGSKYMERKYDVFNGKGKSYRQTRKIRETGKERERKRK